MNGRKTRSLTNINSKWGDSQVGRTVTGSDIEGKQILSGVNCQNTNRSPLDVPFLKRVR